MGDIKLPLHSGAESSKDAFDPKFTPLSPIKIEDEDVRAPLHTIYKILPAMTAEHQPVAAQCLMDAVEINKFERSTVSDRGRSPSDMNKY